jgi:hypothetical protein
MFVLSIVAAVAFGCSDAPSTAPGADVLQKSVKLKFTATMDGSQEVPPVSTEATGTAWLKLSKDGTELDYRVNVFGIDNVTASHIHLAPVGTNGGVVATLFTSSPATGTVNGQLVHGTITADDLSGALAGMELEDLIDRIDAGNAYINVHSTDYPGGEIRGQIEAN